MRVKVDNELFWSKKNFYLLALIGSASLIFKLYSSIHHPILYTYFEQESVSFSNVTQVVWINIPPLHVAEEVWIFSSIITFEIRAFNTTVVFWIQNLRGKFTYRQKEGMLIPSIDFRELQIWSRKGLGENTRSAEEYQTL